MSAYYLLLTTYYLLLTSYYLLPTSVCLLPTIKNLTADFYKALLQFFQLDFLERGR